MKSDLLMNITIVNPTAKKINAKRLNASLKLVISELQKKKLKQKKLLQQKSEIVFIFLTKSQMQKLNFKYRKKNYATDVLSFESADESALGELAFCLPVLKKQAVVQKHSLDHELLYMMIHGILHLLGYDHEVSKPAEKIMFQLQDTVFEQARHLTKVL